jgi:hypothetical protein
LIGTGKLTDSIRSSLSVETWLAAYWTAAAVSAAQASHSFYLLIRQYGQQHLLLSPLLPTCIPPLLFRDFIHPLLPKLVYLIRLDLRLVFFELLGKISFQRLANHFFYLLSNTAVSQSHQLRRHSYRSSPPPPLILHYFLYSQSQSHLLTHPYPR